LFINGKWVDPIDPATIEYADCFPPNSHMILYYESTTLSIKVCLFSICINQFLTVTSPQATKKLITTVPIGSGKDVDVAVEAAPLTLPSLLLRSLNPQTQQAYKNSWGLKCPGTARGKLLAKLADELAALEALNVSPC